ncbi:MAG: hypothetical protein CMK59_11420 [Proteobacteria bacterium]|nr:hypothetical protein [Pseudomonadota bacterium]
MNFECAQKQLLSLHQQGIEYPCVEIELTEQPLAFLSRHSHIAKVYWKARDSDDEYIGLGISDLLIDSENPLYILRNRIQKYKKPLRYFGGFSFSGKLDLQSCFSKNNFWMPTWTIVKTPQRTTLFYCQPKASIQSIEQSVFPLKRSFSWEQWKQMFKEAEHLLQSKLKKIVLAAENYQYSALNPEHYLQSIADPQNYNFLLCPDGKSSFLGSSPERLFKISNNELLTEALAGTRKRGTTPQEDHELSKNLLQSIKDLEEHQVVIEGIKKALKPYSSVLSSDEEPQVRYQKYVQHLYTPIKARLNNSFSTASLDKIFKALHPTPAVCGYPKEEAMRHIQRIEEFDRGWYAGAVGWVDAQNVEFSVAIRSALKVNNDSWFWAGAGLIKSSNSLEEWNEIQAKSIQFRAIQ